MADQILGKKIADLTEKTDPVDTDVYVFGDAGTNVLKKTKWRKMLDAIAARLTANNLTTTVAGYFLDARQGKALKDSVDELNANMPKVKSFTSGLFNVEANTGKTITVALSGLSGKTIDGMVPIARGGMDFVVTLNKTTVTSAEVAVKAQNALTNRTVDVLVFYH